MKTINSLYIGAQTNPAFFDELTKKLIEMAEKMAASIIKKYEIYTVTVEDVKDYILYIVYFIYGRHDKNIGDFEKYAKFVMYKRLTTKIIDLSLTFAARVGSLDEVLEDGTPLMEIIPNDDCKSIPDEISFSEMHLKMSSPKSNDNAKMRILRRVYNLLNAGFSGKEIKSILGLNEAQYRYIIRLMNENIDEMKFKIELK